MRKLPPSSSAPVGKRKFTYIGSVPVEHRDTGNGTASQNPSEMEDDQPTALDDCRDLLREWGAP